MKNKINNITTAKNPTKKVIRVGAIVSKPTKGEKVDCYIDRYYRETGRPVDGTLLKKIKWFWQIKLFNDEIVYLAENAVWGFNRRKAC